VLDFTIFINYVKSGSLNTFLFKEFGKHMISAHEFSYSTCLYAGYGKETFYATFLLWRMK